MHPSGITACALRVSLAVLALGTLAPSAPAAAQSTPYLSGCYAFRGEGFAPRKTPIAATGYWCFDPSKLVVTGYYTGTLDAIHGNLAVATVPINGTYAPGAAGFVNGGVIQFTDPSTTVYTFAYTMHDGMSEAVIDYKQKGMMADGKLAQMNPY